MLGLTVLALIRLCWMRPSLRRGLALLPSIVEPLQRDMLAVPIDDEAEQQEVEIVPHPALLLHQLRPSLRSGGGDLQVTGIPVRSASSSWHKRPTPGRSGCMSSARWIASLRFTGAWSGGRC